MMNELNTRDQQLAQVMRETLEHKAQQYDPLLDAALAAGRSRALAAPQHKISRWWVAGGFALAASLAVVVVLPHANTAMPTEQNVVTRVEMPDADLQLLESMDMLVAMQ
jgi:hypothetical protein